MSESATNISSDRMLEDARTQITSLQAILAETHQHSQEAERRLGESEKKCVEKDVKMRQMRSEMDQQQTDSEERIRRLENNVRVLCQNIENSNSILTMKGKNNKNVPGDLSSKEQDEGMLYDDRTIDQRHQEILQTTQNIDPAHQFSTEKEYERARDGRAELLRREMETWHVQHMSGGDSSAGGGGGDDGGDSTTGNNTTNTGVGYKEVEGEAVELTDARRRYLEVQQREEEERRERGELREMVEMEGMEHVMVYEAGDPYKEDLPAALAASSSKTSTSQNNSPKGKRRKKKKKQNGRRTIFG